MRVRHPATLPLFSLLFAGIFGFLLFTIASLPGGASGPKNKALAQSGALIAGASGDSSTSQPGSAAAGSASINPLGVDSVLASLTSEPGISSDNATIPAPLPPLVPDYDADGFQNHPGGMTITGRVTDIYGRGIANVRIIDQAMTPGSFTMPEPFITDNQGYFTVEVAQAGMFRLHFVPANAGGSIFLDEWYNNTRSGAEAALVPAGASGLQAVLSTGGSIHGHYDFPSETYPMDVVAYDADSGNAAGNAFMHPVSGNPDSFDIDLPPGNYKLLAIPVWFPGSTQELPAGLEPSWYGGADSQATAASVTVRSGQVTYIEMAPHPPTNGTIYGSLSFAGDVYGSGDLSLIDAGDAGHVVMPGPDTAFSNSNALSSSSDFIFSNVPAGSYKLRDTMPGGQTVWYRQGGAATTDFDAATVVTVGQNLTIGPLSFAVIPVSAKVSGRVAWDNGIGVPQSTITMMRTTAAGELPTPYLPLSTDNEGNFQGEIFPGTYRFCVWNWSSGHQYCNAEPLTLGWGESASGIEIVIPHEQDYGNVIGKILRPDGTPPTGGVATATPVSGGTDTYMNLDAAGQYCFNLPSGDYRIHYQGFDTDIYYNGVVKVTPGSIIKGIDIQVPQDIGIPSAVTGKVSYADGSRAAHVLVRASPSGSFDYSMPTYTLEAPTDLDGNFSLCLPPGSYTIFVYAGEWMTVENTFTVTDWNHPITGIDFTLPMNDPYATPDPVVATGAEPADTSAAGQSTSTVDADTTPAPAGSAPVSGTDADIKTSAGTGEPTAK